MPAPKAGGRGNFALRAAFNKAETDMAPLAYLEWVGDKGVFDPTGTRADLAGFSHIEPFVAHDLGAGSTLYQGPEPARNIAVFFVGKRMRFGMPAPALLQRIRAKEWDVLILRDLAQSHYRYGCEGIADSFPGLIAYLARLIGNYRHHVILGYSLGAGAAVRAAIGLGGVPAFALGARPAVDIDRLFKDASPGLAFDPLCACLPPIPRDITYLFGTEFRPDRRAAHMFQAISGGQLVPIPELATHGIVGHLWRIGKIGAFLDAALDPNLKPLPRSNHLAEIFASA